MAISHHPLPLAQPSIARPSASLKIRSISKPVNNAINKKRSGGFISFSRCPTLETLRLRSIQYQGVENVKASTSGFSPTSEGDEVVDKMLEGPIVVPSSSGISLLAKLAIGVGIAATITLISIFGMDPSAGSYHNLPLFIYSSSQSVPAASPVGFDLTIFGYKIIVPEYTPGWVYFWLLMAAGCGLFISEEALNVWVGISIARNLTLDSTWQAFAASFSKNAPYIVSTVLWVYWGVCISDLIPFYLGRIFRKTKASEDICTKLGIGKAKAAKITQAVQKYGNLIGFVERLSIGVRNPTAFLAGAWMGLGFISEPQSGMDEMELGPLDPK